MADDGLNYAVLSGPPPPAHVLPLEEIVRPFAVSRQGISFLYEDARVELSYRELAARTATTAARLRGHGVTAGTLVAMTITNDLPSVLAALGTWAAGGTVVSLPPVPRADGGWYARQFRPVLDAMGCAIFVGGDDHGLDIPARTTIRRIPKLALAEPEPEPGPVDLPDTEVPATALIQFTSGSVDAPKGVAIGAAALARHAAVIIAACNFESSVDKIASWLPLYHDMGLIAMFMTGLAGRMDQVIARPGSFATRPTSWLEMLGRERATITAAPNFAYRLAATVPYSEPPDLSRVRMSVSGAERLDWPTLTAFHTAAAPMGLDWGGIAPCYGLAEGVVAVTYTTPGRGPLRGPGGYVSSGRPVPGTEVRVPAGSSPRPIQMRGASMFSGYHTRDGFVPVEPGWFDTGDAGFVHDGELYVLGRRNEVLSIAGRNVFAEDVEAVAQETGGDLVRACAAFRNPAAAGRFGLLAEANPRLVRGADAARELARLIQSSVSQTLGTRLTPVLVARLGAIPRTTSGKVQRGQCRSIYRNGEITRRLIAEVA
jgi:acyl-CoA synthetase (AMP-forming)/AMP-acid ligase II